MPECPYCSIAPDDAWLANERAAVLPHPDPLIPGHAIVIPRRHVASFYGLDVIEQQALWELVKQIQLRISEGLQVRTFHVGFADSQDSAGHTQIHVVPQGPEDEIDLPGSIQWIKP